MAAIENVEELAFKKELLKAVREAMLFIISGKTKSYRVGSRGLERLSLDELRKMEADLVEEIGGLDGTGGRFRKIIPVW